ncbi:MAG: hypothetical protein HQL83_16610 [Magnetococcales bacterium]|nr:hypothetical protein [Magnetococcales bacterium]
MTSPASPPPAPLNLFALAQANDPALEQQFAAQSAGTSTNATALRDMSALVFSTGNVTVNMRIDVMNQFFATEHMTNIYEWAKEHSLRHGRTQEELLREKLGRWYEQRVKFDEAFIDGNQFRYGALNIDSLGPSKFGDLCVVIKEPFWDDHPVAYLKGDSLKTFMDSHHNLLEDRLRVSVSSKDRRHQMMALKHSPHLTQWEKKDWPRKVCSTDEFVEAIFVKSFTSSQIQEVRIDKGLFFRMNNIAFNKNARIQCTPEEIFQANSFEIINKILHRLGIPLKVIC